MPEKIKNIDEALEFLDKFHGRIDSIEAFDRYIAISDVCDPNTRVITEDFCVASLDPIVMKDKRVIEKLVETDHLPRHPEKIPDEIKNDYNFIGELLMKYPNREYFEKTFSAYFKHTNIMRESEAIELIEYFFNGDYREEWGCNTPNFSKYMQGMIQKTQYEMKHTSPDKDHPLLNVLPPYLFYSKRIILTLARYGQLPKDVTKIPDEIRHDIELSEKIWDYISWNNEYYHNTRMDDVRKIFPSLAPIGKITDEKEAIWFIKERCASEDPYPTEFRQMGCDGPDPYVYDYFDDHYWYVKERLYISEACCPELINADTPSFRFRKDPVILCIDPNTLLNKNVFSELLEHGRCVKLSDLEGLPNKTSKETEDFIRQYIKDIYDEKYLSDLKRLEATKSPFSLIDLLNETINETK